MRTLTITAAEWASARDGALWLVREGLWDAPPDTDVLAGQSPFRPIPPVEFVQACAPCETCGNARRRTVRDLSGVETFGVPCPDCRIELEITDGFAFPVVVGHAYAVGQPLPIHQNGWTGGDHLAVKLMQPHMGGGGHYSMAVYRRNTVGGLSMTPEFGQKAQRSLAHAGPPESLIDKWAQQLRVVQS